MSTKTTTPAAVVTDMSREQAEQVTADIRQAGKSLATARTTYAAAIKRAKAGNAHLALGFKSWPAYVADLFHPEAVKGMAQVDRDYLTAVAAEEGVSTRIIARMMGVSQSTAARQVRALIEAGKVSEDREVTGEDGKAQTGKGKGKGRAAKPAAGPDSRKGEETHLAIGQASTEDLRLLALAVLGELSSRWAEGDEAAEVAIAEVAAFTPSK